MTDFIALIPVFNVRLYAYCTLGGASDRELTLAPRLGPSCVLFGWGMLGAWKEPKVGLALCYAGPDVKEAYFEQGGRPIRSSRPTVEPDGHRFLCAWHWVKCAILWRSFILAGAQAPGKRFLQGGSVAHPLGEGGLGHDDPVHAFEVGRGPGEDLGRLIHHAGLLDRQLSPGSPGAIFYPIRIPGSESDLASG